MGTLRRANRTRPAKRNVRSTRRITANNSGMTLLEVVLGIGIFSIVMVSFLQVLMSVHRTNNAVAASMTANAATRSLADEAIATAAEAAKAEDLSYAAAFLKHYRDMLYDSGENFTLPIGPNGTGTPRMQLEFMGGSPVLVHHFPVPEPGSFSRYTTTAWSGGAAVGDIVPYKYGVGTMYIHADETLIPDNGMAGGTLTGEPPLTANGIPLTWETSGVRPAGDTTGTTNGYFDNSPAGVDAYITSPNAPLPAGLNRIFADISITYYDDPAHRRVLATDERRILVTGSFDSAGRNWPQ